MTASRQLRLCILSDGQMGLVIPSPSGGEHTVAVPETVEGLRIVRETLVRFTAEPDARIGSRGHLTQWQVDQMLRAFKPEPRPQPARNVAVKSERPVPGPIDIASIKL